MQEVTMGMDSESPPTVSLGGSMAGLSEGMLTGMEGAGSVCLEDD